MSERSRSGPEDVLGALRRHAAALLGEAPGPLRRIRVQVGDASVEVEWPREAAAAPAAAPGPAGNGTTPATGDGSAGTAAGAHLVRAPMVGTFYRAPAPGAKPFVEVGETVEAGQQVAVVEAMKLMNAIVADCAGTVAEVLVDDATPVEYDQPLIAIVPGEPG